MNRRGSSWESFAAEVAQILGVAPADIARETRLIEDLDADSLAVIEVITFLITDFQMSVPDGLDTARWKGLTAGALHDAALRGSWK